MITILMAVYNGEKHLSQQIESIIEQTYSRWKLVICDDCSTDNSFDIIREYSKMYPDKIYAYRNATPTGSAQANFMNMLKYSDTEYTMFCDQDDVWLPDKISLTLNEMKRIEQCKGNIPVLVHTDMMVVDSELNQLSASFMKYCRYNPSKRDLNHLLVQNNISGCTVMINKNLLEMVINIPASHMLMHDWWLGLTAAAFGKIGYVDKPTSMYRQHTDNQLGAKQKDFKYYIEKIKDSKKNKDCKVTTFMQAEYFLECYKNMLPDKERRIASVYSEFESMNVLCRWYNMFRYRLWKQNAEGIASQILMLL